MSGPYPIALTACSLVLAVNTGSALADSVADCTQLDDPALTISACSTLIKQADRGSASLADAYNNRGLAYQSSGKFPEALADFSKAISLEPTVGTYYFNRGNIYAVNDRARAIVDYQNAVRLDSTLIGAWTNLGLVQQQDGDFKKAKESYDKALAIDRENVAVIINIAWWHEEQGNKLAAKLLYMKVRSRPNLTYLERDAIDSGLARVR